MRAKRNWTEAIIASIGQLRFNNLLKVQGLIFAPSGGLNRYVREYLESESGITKKIWLRDIHDTDLGEEIREQLKGAIYLKNIVLYELDPVVLDRIAHQLMIGSPRLVLRLVRGKKRIVEDNHHFDDFFREPDSDLFPGWP